MTHVSFVSKCIFQWLFKDIVFSTVALVTQKSWAILDFIFRFFSTLYLQKNPLNYFSLKVTKFHGDSVKNESVKGQKNTGLGLNVF